jgi:general secretion pathway protein C
MTSMTRMVPAAEQLIERITSSRWTPIGINVVAMLLLTYSLAQWSWRLMEPAPVLTDRRPAAPIADGAAELRQLLSANLFGQVDLTAGQAGLSPDSIPLTSLNLVLTGVMVGGTHNFAFISVNGGNETAFGIGEEILAGAALHAVYPDRAVLRRAGALESLVLKDILALPEGSIVTSPQYRKDAPPLSGIRGSGGNYTVERNTLTQQMQKPEFLSQALMVPNAGGGFLVREIQPGSVYEKLGVRPGDVIRSVNGQPINNMDEVMKLYQQLGANQISNVAIEITRGGRTESLQYNIE